MVSGLSIVIPAYDAEHWLGSTIEKLYDAIKQASLSSFEVIVVNDGSHDNTFAVAQSLAKKHKAIKVLTHENKGRFITRKRGVMTAKYERVLFIDSRVWIDEGSLSFLFDQLSKYPERKVWNGHINVAKKGNIIARFGDSLTILGWRRYFRKPHLTSYGVEDFDHYPKGTGLFTCPRDILIEAIEWFESTTTDVKNSSDDTLLIRRIADRERIWLSPDFSATYFARTTLGAFIKHSYFRGQFFVDGFLRKDTRFYYPLLAFILLSPFVLISVVVFPKLLLVGLACWVLILPTALILGLLFKDAISFFILAPLFAVTYGAGIWKAVIGRII